MGNIGYQSQLLRDQSLCMLITSRFPRAFDCILGSLSRDQIFLSPLNRVCIAYVWNLRHLAQEQERERKETTYSVLFSSLFPVLQSARAERSIGLVPQMRRKYLSVDIGVNEVKTGYSLTCLKQSSIIPSSFPSFIWSILAKHLPTRIDSYLQLSDRRR